MIYSGALAFLLLGISNLVASRPVYLQHRATVTAADFGSCPLPEIEFGAGFDGRRETSFQPVNQTAYNHGSADNIAVITNFMCLALVNTCNADAAAKAACATAQSAAQSAAALTGAQADAWNAVFGISTNFAAVQEVSNTGVAVNNNAASQSSISSAGTSTTSSSPSASTVTASSSTTTSASTSDADFGSCTTPEIKFATGFDNRKETSFEPVNQTSYNHGSAQNIDIITQFMCDALTNSCDANEAAKTLCAQAAAAADTVTAKTGGQADAFNAVFGIKTDFAAVAPVSDQGVTLSIVASTSTAAAAAASTVGSTSATSAALDVSTCAIVTSTKVVTVTATASSISTGAALIASATAAAATSTNTSGASFGKCSTPEIKFGTGFDNRKETSFEPVDQTSYNHGSAQNINIITQFMCDTLTNTCDANQAAKTLCAQATTAADTVTSGTGGQADAFNAVFGIKTDFAAVAPVSDTGVTLSITASTSAAAATVTASASATATSINAAATCAAPTTVTSAVVVTVTAGATATASATATSSTSGADFGKCTTPEIKFATGFDNRKETSYEPVDQTSYNHGSADDIDIITQFMCNTLTNTCDANQAAKDLCAQAAAAADTVTAKTGGQADAFNAVFGIKTNFAAVAPVSDTGVTLSITATTAASTATASAA